MAEPSGAVDIHAGWRQGALTSRRPAVAAGPRRCRVEHHRAGTIAVLARGLVALPTHGELAPFAARLRLEGAAGEVVLVDEAGGAELARRAVVPRR